MKEKMKKFTKILLLIAMIFSDLVTPVSVLANEITGDTPSKGAIGVNQTASNTDSVTVSLGGLTEEGDVQVTKTVSPTEKEGRYKIEFNIKGKEIVNSIESTKPVYVVVVFDRSGSMEEINYDNCIDPGFLWCDEYEEVKFSAAVSGAKTFASTLLEKIPTANIALVTFASNTSATPARDFSTANLDNANFGSPNGGTNLHAGLKMANSLLSGENIPENSNKYVVVISDGQPTYYVNSNGQNDDDGSGNYTSRNELVATLAEANAIKEKTLNGETVRNAEIFTIGYSLPTGVVYNDTNDNTVPSGQKYGELTAQDILTMVATEDSEEDRKNNISHYIDANPAAIVTAFTNIATSISRTPAGTNATLTDNIGGKFNIVGQEGNTFTSDVIEEITETGTIISFEVEIDESKVTSDGWYNTNEGFSLTYTDSTGEVKTLSSNVDPQVYWVPPVYQYTVNYYKDSISDTPIKTDVIEVNNGTVVTGVDQNKYLNNNSLGTVGYEFNSVTGVPVTITDNSTVIDVLYTIKTFNYNVNYYYDGELDHELSHTISDINYGTEVEANSYYEAGAREGYSLDEVNSTSGTVIIDKENKEINIYYKKNSYGYTINYYFNNNIDNDFTKDNINALYGSVINAQDNYLTDSELEDKNTEDDTKYFINPVRPSNPNSITIGTNEGNNVINIYYVSTVVTNEDIEKTSDTNKITSGNTPVKYTVEYTSIVNNVNKGDTVKVVITDTLPLEIDENNSNLNGGVYDATNKTITWTYEEIMTDFTESYDASKTITYTVVYKNVGNGDGSDLVNSVAGSTTAGGKTTTEIVDTASVNVEIPGNVVVHYYETGTTNSILNDKTLNGFVGEVYETTSETVFGYTLDNDNLPSNQKGTYTENTIEVIYYYTKNAGTIEEVTVEKTASDKTVDSIDSTFNYTISATGEVRDYVGEVTIKVVDTPSNTIDREKSVIGERCSITGDREITCIKTVTITEEDYVDGVYNVNEEFTLDLVFTDIENEVVTNNVKVEITLNDSNVKEEDNDTEEVEVSKGKVTAIYVDEEDNELADKEESSDLVGKEYTTEAKDIFGYTLTADPENKDGVYTKDDITVKYVYSKNAGTVDNTEVVKTAGDKTADSIDSTFNYTISATGEVRDYVGEVTIKVVDTPSNTIDREKSVIGEGCSITGDREITCIKTVTITEEDYVDGVYNVNEEFTLDLVFTDIKNEVVTNNAKVEITLNDSNVKEEDNDTEEVQVSKGTVVVTYKDTEGNVLSEEVTTTGLAGTEYETKEKSFYGYTLKNITGNDKEGLYLANQTLTVNYVYTKNDGTISDNELVKVGPNSIASIDETFDYTFSYNANISDYVGDATLKLTDTLPFGAVIVSKDNRCTYDDNRTITCIENYNITGDTSINEEFNISLKYVGISFDDITVSTMLTNKLVAELTYGDNKVIDNASKDTIVNIGTVVATYKDTEGNVLSEEVTTRELAGVEYETEEKEFFGYTLDEVPSNASGKYASNQTIEVNYVYTKNAGTVDNTEVVKTASDKTVDSIDSTFNYTISATGEVRDYVGEVTIKVVDTPSNTVDREKSVIGEGCSITGDREITCIKTVTITEEDYVDGVYNVNEEFTLDLVFTDIDNEVVTNNAKVEITLNDSNIKEENTDTEEVEVSKGKVTVIYKDTLGNILHDDIELEGLVGSEYTTDEKSFYGYTLNNIPNNKNGVYTKEDIIVEYIYSKNVGTSSEELVKEGIREVDNINSAFDYTITYNTIIMDYVGESTLVITDELPYEIDTEKSLYNKDNCIYSEGKLVCTYIKNITEEDNKFDIYEEFTLYYLNITDSKVTNKVVSELVYGTTTKTNNSEYTSEVKMSTVVVNYVDKNGNKLTDSITLDGMVGTTYSTEEKIFDSYKFVSVNGDVEGVYIEDVIEITYVYELIVLPPQTGVNMNLFIFVKYIMALVAIIVAGKTYDLIKNN